MLELITSVSLWDLVKHAGIWISNLKRAKGERKKDSIEALRRVIIVARKTSVYVRQLNDSGTRTHDKEAELSLLWTELGFSLEDLGIKKLAKRCNLKGKHWSDPELFSREHLNKTDVGLEKMEQIASAILDEIKS